MKKFILRTLVFVLVAFGLPILCAFGPIFIGGKLVSFKCPHATTVLIGDSTCEYGLDDSLLPGVVNMGLSSSSIPHSYWRLRKYLRENPQTKRVIFTWQPNILTGKVVETYTYYTSLKHLPFMSFGEIASFYTTQDLVKFFRAAFKGRSKGPDPFILGYCFPRREYWGRYRPTDERKLMVQLSKSTASGRKQCLIEDPPEYLIKMIEMVEAFGADFEIFLPPLYRYDDYFDHDAEYARISAFIPAGTRILDYSRFTIPDDEWRDMVHLNSAGARRLSVAFAKEVDPSLVLDNRE